MALTSRLLLSVASLALLATRARAQPAPPPSAAADAAGSSIGRAIVDLGAKGALGTDRLAGLLRDPDPLARAGAARLVRVLEARSLLPGLRLALGGETSQAAAAEMATALAALEKSGAADEELFAAATRFAGAIDGPILRGLGLRDGPSVTLSPRLLALRTHSEAWRDFFGWSLGRGAAALDGPADAVVTGGSADAWSGLLELAAGAGHTLPAAALERALASPDAREREATAWYLLGRARAEAVDRAWLARTIESSPEARGEGDAMQRLAHELLRRAAGLPARDQAAILGAVPRDEGGRLPSDRRALKGLSREERRACSRIAFGDPDALDEQLRHAPKDDEKEAAREPLWMGTPDDLLPGLAEEAMSAAGCRIVETPWALLEVRHDAEGRRRGFDVVVPKQVAPACEPAVRGLLLSTLVPPRARPRPQETRLVLMPLEPDYFACVAKRLPASVPPERVAPGGRIVEPTKVRNVPPVYPRDMVNQRIQGVVILEAVISPQGCISSTEVVRSVEPQLDVAAVRSVAQWRYTPTLLNGIPVPVVMTVTVNFRLRN